MEERMISGELKIEDEEKIGAIDETLRRENDITDEGEEVSR